MDHESRYLTEREGGRGWGGREREGKRRERFRAQVRALYGSVGLPNAFPGGSLAPSTAAAAAAGLTVMGSMEQINWALQWMQVRVMYERLYGERARRAGEGEGEGERERGRENNLDRTTVRGLETPGRVGVRQGRTDGRT